MLIHSGEKPFNCNQCTSSFSQRDHLKQHISTHSGKKHFSCDQCNFSCNHAGSLKIHMRQHSGEKPFACNQCNFSCRDSSGLKYHRLSHTGEKPFACEKCDYSCKESVLLRRHMKKHTPKASTPGKWFFRVILTCICYILYYLDQSCDYSCNQEFSWKAPSILPRLLQDEKETALKMNHSFVFYWPHWFLEIGLWLGSL